MIERMSSSSEVIVTYLNIILYAISYQLQRPVEPFLVRSLIHNNKDNVNSQEEEDEESAANRTYGKLTSFFSCIQTIGSPLVGILLDKIGPRYTSILVYLASASSYWILANATSSTWLYCSKLPTLLQHAFLVGQATVSSVCENGDSTEESSARSRAAALGRMTTAYTIGATIGPALGGYLGASDLFAGARLAVWGSLLSVALSILYLKDHHHLSSYTKKKKKEQDECKEEEDEQSQSTSNTNTASFLQSVQKTSSYLRHPTIGPLLFVKLLNGISSSTFSTILPLILANKLHFTTTQLGYFMSASSLSVAVFAAVGIVPSLSFVGNRSDKLAYVGIGCRLLSIIVFGLVVTHVISNLLLVVEKTPQEENDVKITNEGLIITTMASVAISLSSHLHATSLTTLTTGTVTRGERGAIIGLEHSLFSLARVVGPPLGTTLLNDASGIWRVIWICVIMDLVLMACLKVWSAKQYSKILVDMKMSDDGNPLLNENDHDHSD